MFPVLKQFFPVNQFRAFSVSSESYNKKLIRYGEYLVSCLPKYIEKVTISRGDELNVHVPITGLLPTLEFLRDHSRCQYKQLMEMTAVDWIKSTTTKTKGRFELIYCLLSIQHNSRLILHTFAESSTQPSVPSVTSLFPSANWSERETFDLFGVIFEGHPDLRRIMTDYGFEGHPLRKDFPLTGFVEVRYDEEVKRVIEEPLELTQEFRKFEYSSPVRIRTNFIL
jgi:NADH dehydrogenase (ubiquinone) Fe-S protein 3